MSLWRRIGKHIPGAKAQFAVTLDVRAEARTYLRSNSNGNGENNDNSKNKYGGSSLRSVFEVS
jgi:hypothetical protein